MPEGLAGIGALVEEILIRGGNGRLIVALAGPPGAGKSHVADDLAARLNAARPDGAAVLAMDGFHYDDGVLEAAGRRAAKGAPDTFDVGGLAACLRRLRARDEDAVAVPLFDRALEISRGSARLIARAVEVVIVEGNYLLLDRAPWSALAPLFDITVMLDVPEATLARRLTARWQGFGQSPEAIRHKLDTGDLPNGRLVRGISRAADFVLAN